VDSFSRGFSSCQKSLEQKAGFLRKATLPKKNVLEGRCVSTQSLAKQVFSEKTWEVKPHGCRNQGARRIDDDTIGSIVNMADAGIGVVK
jgi:hypothetical protein